LFAATERYLWESTVVCGNLRLSMAIYGCSRQSRAVSRRCRVVCGKTTVIRRDVRLFAAEQGYPRQNNLVYGGATLFAAA
jgi:hypothetical protein